MLKKILIYVCLGLFFLPVSALTTIDKASAATKASPVGGKIEKTKLQPTSKTQNLQIDTKIVTQTSAKLAELVSIKGLKEEAYHNGERVMLTIVLDDKTISSVWAKINTLDPSFKPTQQLTSQGSNAWQLITPVLSHNLNNGSQVITIYIQNKAGVAQFNFIVSLELETAGLIVNGKTDENNIFLNWNANKQATSYIVTYKDQSSNVSHIRTIEKNYLDLIGLNENTSYEIQITAMGENGLLAQSAKMRLQTQQALVLSEINQKNNNASSLQPTITAEAVSTQAEIVSNSSSSKTITATPAPTVTPAVSSSPQAQTNEEESSWNRWLVALAILVIAIGAAIGGYYGYEWWSNREEENEPPTPKSSNRW